MTTFAIACLVPIATLLGMACLWCPRNWKEWKPRVLTVLILFAAGVYAASPFFRGTYVGTGEAYNYGLSVADAVTQARAGVFPVLVGQTEFAFNGRIHPVRTAPGYCCAACLIDFATFHRLNIWQIQDAILILSLVCAAFAAYAALRYLVGATHLVSLLGAVLYEFSPGVISTAYAMDLYMTVTTLPLIPLVLGSNVATFSRRTAGLYVVLGASIGLAWLAHPPIALWLSACTAAIQLAVWTTRRPSLRELIAVAPGLLVCVLLAGYSLESASAIRGVGGLSRPEDYSPMFIELRKAFPASIKPVSAEARDLSDFQLGYVGWALLFAGGAAALLRRRLAPLVLFAVAGFLLVLTLPVPYVTRALWLHLPPAFPNLTNIWPMQRLYLVATGLILVGAFAQWRDADLTVRALPIGRRLGLGVLLAAGLAWEIGQARQFIRRGDVLQHGGQESADLLRPENIDLTVTSYALLGLPRRFVNGVMDPGTEFRILRASDRAEIANNWSPPNAGKLRARGVLHTSNMHAGLVPLIPTIRIEPHRRYFLTLNFRTPPFTGVLVMDGDHFRRGYPLPSAGEDRGFGMKPGNDRSLVLWTTDPEGTEISMSLVGMKDSGPFADFELREIDPKSFPVELGKLVPLSGRVRSNEAAWLETPRRFIPGYAATVDGRKARVGASPEGSVMIEIPAGEHDFRLRYPGSTLLLVAFWTSFSTGCVLALVVLGWLALRASLQVRRAALQRGGASAVTPIP
jgi:hypothetical protein